TRRLPRTRPSAKECAPIQREQSPGRRRERPGSGASRKSPRKLVYIQRKPTAHTPTIGRRSGGELAAESDGALPHTDQAIARSFRLLSRPGGRSAGFGDET